MSVGLQLAVEVDFCQADFKVEGFSVFKESEVGKLHIGLTLTDGIDNSQGILDEMAVSFVHLTDLQNVSGIVAVDLPRLVNDVSDPVKLAVFG